MSQAAATRAGRKRVPAPAGSKTLQVLIAAHSHPELSRGGGEIAAFELFRRLQARSDCQAWFLGCDGSAPADRSGPVFRQPYSAAEYLYAAGAFDGFKFANPDPRFREAFEDLLRELSPDVVHFHHYMKFGVEVFAHVRRVLPQCRIILTLHEYLAICHHYGQMVTSGHLALCHRATPSRCQACFPAFTGADFFLRHRYIMRFFDLIDRFVAPSRFLAERYLAWGLPAERLVVLENLMPPPAPPPALQRPPEGPLRIGFFGQTTPLKGIEVLFDAAAALAAEGVTGVSFEIHGDYRTQPEAFQSAFLQRLSGAGRNIRYVGPYDGDQLDRLMQSVHAVLVPSVWWENSPVVIQEALRNRRPVLCSDIGGMAEKVRDGVDGLHFPAGNALALASLLRRLSENRAVLADLAASLTGSAAVASNIEDYFAIYAGR